ncbi:MAG TPA: methyltransferase domain-containing protein [Gaiella sp.]|nr:methyltransferase domain-containing protein [Gaiella sp.]
MSEPIDNWRSVAPGWERQRPLFLESTHVVSERLVELLDPVPGETVLELAAGPGDTGLLAARSLSPGGHLVSTDFAQEMVDAARRRACELGLGDELVSFGLEDMTSLSFDDASFDGVVCRWGLMLVPDIPAAAGEIARVLRPGGRASLGVWADPDDNDWMTAAGRSALELGLAERPEPDAPGPFRLSGDGLLAEVLEDAGLNVEVVEDVDLTWRVPSLAAWWKVMLDTARSLALILENATEEQAEAVRAGGERRLERYVQPDGSLAVPGRARVALARRPT